MSFEPYSLTEQRQEKEGITVELKNTKDLPPSFTATVAACDRYGRQLLDPAGQPVMDRVSLARKGQFWEQVAITNYTDHVIRVNGVVIRLFDPGGNQIESLSWDDLFAQLMAERPCPSSQTAMQIFRVNKIFDRNMEIVPGTTSTFWVAFRPPSMQMTGVWRFAFYEMPVKIDAAGRPTRTAQFEMRVVARQFVDTYQREGLENPRLVESKEVNPTVAPSAQTVPPTPQPQSAEVAPNSQPPAAQTRSETSKLSPAALNKDVVTRAQAQLKSLGLDPGPVDGGLGPRTRDALRRFQASKGLAATGNLDRDTLDALGIK